MVKNIRFLGLFMLVLMAVACQKELSVDSSNSGSTPTNTAAFRMKINGVQWEADKASSVNMLFGATQIGGLSKTNKLLTITLSDTIARTYKLDLRSIDYASLSDSADAAKGDFTTQDGSDSTQSGGIVIVTSVDKAKKTISGTFQFKLYRQADKKQLVITEGVFDQLPYSTTLPPARSTDTLKAKLNTTDWAATSISAINNSGIITMVGTDASVTKAITLAFPAAIVPGTYPIDGNIVTGTYLAGITSPYLISSGSLTILAHNTTQKRIRGSFSFTAKDLATGTQTVQVTQGYFSLNYQ